jgi:hypothetical protein
MMRNRLYSLIFVAGSTLTIILCAPFSRPLYAQAPGSIGGIVVDSTTAAIPGADLSLRDIGTGQVRKTVASAEGYFEFPDLPAHQFSLTISANGFQQFVYDSLTLEVGQRLDLKPVLQVGNVKEIVQVSGTPPPVSTSDSSVSQLVDSERIEDLPLNGRNALDLIALSPGVVSTGAYGQFGAMQDSFYIAGGRGVDTNFVLDGGYNINTFYDNANDYPNPDALQEFRVGTRSYDAEYGRGSSEITAVTKSGTNAFHGSLFEFLRNDALDSRPFFSPVVSPFKRNQYGHANVEFTAGAHLFTRL